MHISSGQCNHISDNSMQRTLCIHLFTAEFTQHVFLFLDLTKRIGASEWVIMCANFDGAWKLSTLTMNQDWAVAAYASTWERVSVGGNPQHYLCTSICHFFNLTLYWYYYILSCLWVCLIMVLERVFLFSFAKIFWLDIKLGSVFWWDSHLKNVLCLNYLLMVLRKVFSKSLPNEARSYALLWYA
jgi:hypothetical protein